MSRYNQHAQGPRLSLSKTLLATLGLLATLSTVFATPALASKQYVASTPFGELGSGAGQLEAPEGVAVNETTGDVYIADPGNHRIDEFSSTGTFLRAWGWGVGDGISKELQTCTLTCFKGLTGSGAGEFDDPNQVAVNNSTGPAAGDVYVSDPENGRVEQFTASGTLVAQITGVCEKAGEAAPCSDSALVRFEEPHGVAVDPSGDLWVYDNSLEQPEAHADELSGAGALLRSFRTEHRVKSIAVDSSGDVYAVSRQDQGLKYDSATATLVAQINEEGQVTAIAVDSVTNDLLVVEQEGQKIGLYVPFAGTPPAPTQTFPAEGLEGSQGVTADAAAETLYASQNGAADVVPFSNVIFPSVTTDSALEVGETTVTLHGTVNPEGEEVTACEFEYGPDAAEPGKYPTKEVACAQSTPFSGGERQVTASVTGLEPRHTYHYRLIAANAHGASHGDDASVFTVSRPLVEAESASGVTSDEATVGAQIDAAGLSTTYEVEYGTSSAYGSSSPKMTEISLGAPQVGASAQVQLTGLRFGAQYHYRFVATNALGVTDGNDETFSTPFAYGASTSTLPDDRAYELLTASPTIGELFVPISVDYRADSGQNTNRPFQAAVNGDSIAYVAFPSATGGSGGIAGGLGTEWLATRTQEGWQSSDITPVGSNDSAEYQAFSNDLSFGVEINQQLLAPGALSPPCNNLYARTSSSGRYSALFTMAPGGCGNPAFAGATDDFSQVLFQSEAPLTPEAEETETPEKPGTGEHAHSYIGQECQLDCNLYDSAGGQLWAINILPGGGAPVPNATFGGASVEGPPDFSNVISTDGTRVFWSDTQPGSEMGHVYMRKNPSQPESPHGIAGECTIPADACTVAVSAGAAEYWTSTPDGRYAFYSENGELWRFDTSPEPEPEPRKAFAGKGVNGENAGVLGVIGTNQTGVDGAYVYFVAEGVLATNENANKETAARGKVEGKPNLYLLHAGVTTFIATLAPADDAMAADQTSYAGMRYGDWQVGLGERTAEVTPDGRHLVFESQEPLTGYDNRNAVTNALDEEVFVYSAEEELTRCASCDPEGRPPTVIEGEEVEPFTQLPVTLSDTRSIRWISDDGDRVFFNSPQALVPQDGNRVQDVYEWELEGAGSCTSATAANDGCVSVLSGGESADNSYLAEADAEGNNVFVVTRAQLLPRDRDDKMDLYDVRVDGGFPESSLACTGTGCQGVPPAPPSFATPSSVTFAGAGNFAPANPQVKRKSAAQLKAEKLAKALKACRLRRGKQKRKACEAMARKRYGPPSRKAKFSKRGTRTRSGDESSKGTHR